MNNALLHAMNKTHTFVDVESGQFISLPKDGTDKPPVNADINNNIDTFHSTGGEGTPSEQIPIVNVSEYDKTVCGKNLLDINTFTNKYDVDTLISDSDIIITATSLGAYRRVQSTSFILPAGTYYIYRDFEIISGTDAGAAGRAIVYEADTGNIIRQNNGSFILLNTTEVILTLYLNTGSALVDLLSIRFYNMQIERSSSYTGWQKYNGNTYPYRLEDVNGVLHEAGDLPDGTKDSYDRDNNLFIERTIKYVVDSNTVINKFPDEANKPLLARFYLSNSDIANFTDGVTGTNLICRSEMQKAISYLTSIGALDYEYCFQNVGGGENRNITFTIFKSSFTDYANLTDAQRCAEAKTLLQGCKFLMLRKVPVTYQIKQYGKTYGGVVWEYNEKPKSIQYHTNIFTDKNIDIQCEVRKLGNRKMSEFYWVTENGDKIITEDEDYIMLEY